MLLPYSLVTNANLKRSRKSCVLSYTETHTYSDRQADKQTRETDTVTVILQICQEKNNVTMIHGELMS